MKWSERNISQCILAFRHASQFTISHINATCHGTESAPFWGVKNLEIDILTY